MGNLMEKNDKSITKHKQFNPIIRGKNLKQMAALNQKQKVPIGFRDITLSISVPIYGDVTVPICGDVTVSHIIAGGAVSATNLEVGDIVRSINGSTPANLDEAVRLIEEATGQIQIVVHRKSTAVVRASIAKSSPQEQLGARIKMFLDDTIAVSHLRPGSAAAADLEYGDAIKSVNGWIPTTLSEAAEMIRCAPKGKVEMVVKRRVETLVEGCVTKISPRDQIGMKLRGDVRTKTRGNGGRAPDGNGGTPHGTRRGSVKIRITGSKDYEHRHTNWNILSRFTTRKGWSQAFS